MHPISETVSMFSLQQLTEPLARPALLISTYTLGLIACSCFSEFQRSCYTVLESCDPNEEQSC